MRRPVVLAFAFFTAALLAGCDMLGIESPEKVAAARDADGKAIGAACRHAARAIEDCYLIYKKADRAAIFAGWRDMNDYMRENKMDSVAPQLSAQAGAAPLATKRGGDAKGGRETKADAETAKTAQVPKAAAADDTKPADS